MADPRSAPRDDAEATRSAKGEEASEDARSRLHQLREEAGGALAGRELAKRFGLDDDGVDAPPLDWRMTPRNVALQLVAVAVFIGVIWVSGLALCRGRGGDLRRGFMTRRSAAGRREARQAATAPEIAPEFWRTKTLEEMNSAEWEALCDGCGKCCLLKLEDDETGRVWYTDVACRLFDDATCRCGNYALRRTLVSQCMVLTPEVVRETKDWMPRTCAYRLVADGYDLYSWHPLVSGDPESVHTSNVSVKGMTTPEYEAPEETLVDRIIGENI